MNTLTDADRGWARAGIHFICWAFGPVLAAGIAHRMGASVYWFSALSATPIFAIGSAAILIEEIIELALRWEDREKFFIDLTAKEAGLAFGLLAWTGWWF